MAAILGQAQGRFFCSSRMANIALYQLLKPAVSSQPLDHVPLDEIDVLYTCKLAGVGVVHLSR